MSSISFEEAMAYEESRNNQNKVGFFSIKEDGGEAIVRILIDDVSQFNILNVHSTGEGKSFRKVECLRTRNDPFEKCPLCASKVKMETRIYIPMLVYTKNEQGTMNCQAVIWDRSLKKAQQLKSYLDNYGPLSEMVCKVVRKGLGLNTDYEIIPNLSKMIYSDSVYVKDTSAFENFNLVGTQILAKTYDELAYYASNKKFPDADTTTTDQTVDVQQQNYVSAQNTYMSTTPAPAYTSQPQYAPVQQSYTSSPTIPNAPTTAPKPWEQANTGVVRTARIPQN